MGVSNYTGTQAMKSVSLLSWLLAGLFLASAHAVGRVGGMGEKKNLQDLSPVELLASEREISALSSGYNHRQNHDHTHKHKHGHKHGHDHSHKHSHTQEHTHVADHNHDHAHVHHHKHNHIHGHDEDHKHAHTEGHTHSHKYSSSHRRSSYEDRRKEYERLAVDHTKDFLKTYMGTAYKRLTGY